MPLFSPVITSNIFFCALQRPVFLIRAGFPRWSSMPRSTALVERSLLHRPSFPRSATFPRRPKRSGGGWNTCRIAVSIHHIVGASVAVGKGRRQSDGSTPLDSFFVSGKEKLGRTRRQRSKTAASGKNSLSPLEDLLLGQLFSLLLLHWKKNKK